jgi:hypothetical protein
MMYTAYSPTTPSDSASPFSGVSTAAFAKDIAVNVTSAYAAAQHFAELPARDGHNRVFIFTGNMEFSLLVPDRVTMGVGKNAMAYAIELAAATYGQKLSEEASFWYFGDERLPSGGSVMDMIDGQAHAQFYWELAQRTSQGPWNATFVKGKGYVDFESWRNRPLTEFKELFKAAHEYQGDGK